MHGLGRLERAAHDGEQFKDQALLERQGTDRGKAGQRGGRSLGGFHGGHWHRSANAQSIVYPRVGDGSVERNTMITTVRCLRAEQRRCESAFAC